MKVFREYFMSIVGRNNELYVSSLSSNIFYRLLDLTCYIDTHTLSGHFNVPTQKISYPAALRLLSVSVLYNKPQKISYAAALRLSSVSVWYNKI